MSQQYVKREYPLSDVTARIIAAATEVHRTLGPGFEFGTAKLQIKRLAN
jgi:hypothetical protein